MTYMSCEAVTAGLVLTGIVHADPHEGNIMLAGETARNRPKPPKTARNYRPPRGQHTPCSHMKPPATARNR